MSGAWGPEKPPFFSSTASAMTHSDVVIRLATLAASTRAVRTTCGRVCEGNTVQANAGSVTPPFMWFWLCVRLCGGVSSSAHDLWRKTEQGGVQRTQPDPEGCLHRLWCVAQSRKKVARRHLRLD